MTRSLPSPLSPEQLRAACALDSLPVAEGSVEITGQPLAALHPRAATALKTALTIDSPEYNIYLAGDPHLGRTRFLKEFFEPVAKAAPTPPDFVYVYNFDDPDKPKIISLDPGQGKALKAELAEVIDNLREEIPMRFEQESHVAKQNMLAKTHQTIREDLHAEMEDLAREEGFSMDFEESGTVTLYPVIEGKAVGGEDFERLPSEMKKSLRAKIENMMDQFSDIMRRVNKEDRGYREQEKRLERDTADQVLSEFLDPLIERHGHVKDAAEYFEGLREDILDNLDAFLPRGESAAQSFDQAQAGDDVLDRYEINVFVDNSQTTGAPVIIEGNPAYFNLMGSIERESEMGALFTSYRLIKAGSLHKAHGGYLIIKIDDLLRHQGSAWEALLRALRLGRSPVEDPAESGEQTRTKTIEPEAMPAKVRVILVGTDEEYEYLLYGEERFRKLFKIKAHMQNDVDRTSENIGHILAVINGILSSDKLLPFSRKGQAALIEHLSSMADDQEKLSLHFPLLRELLIEASAIAAGQQKAAVDDVDVETARRAALFRNDLFQEEFLSEYDREMIKVSTTGQAIGRVNGLAVRMFGDHAFGLPHQIACTVGVGHGGILDLEREAELGGPIHTKAMMILKSYLISLFARDKPLVLTGALCFEQSYVEVEGDSASGAELAALLSALAERPIHLGFAFTGAVSQSGAILAVGGVNQKIEGFFAVCKRRGLTGSQGVLIPKDNVVNLMLHPDVIDAVKAGQFHIYPVENIEQAMELLTGLPAGLDPHRPGLFALDSLYALVDERLTRLAQLAVKWDRGNRNTL
ncbi:Lon protease family protein [Desulfovibrio inopinatus]|uniref:Lon protease family protein n=1 Tax=Desulfovibrio inopinatus TaxID=102109 RepID=UPI0003FA7C7F|nr:ATP-binding protein [Desulfovibrio inopinatus]